MMELGLLALFVLVGVVIVIFNVIHINKLKSVCLTEIDAKCIDVRRKYGDSRVSYSPVYKISFHGVDYTLDSHVYVNANHWTKGETYKIKINAERPTQYIDSATLYVNKVFIIIGVVFVVLGLFVGVSYIL